jgi:hypothetical protein
MYIQTPEPRCLLAGRCPGHPEREGWSEGVAGTAFDERRNLQLGLRLSF